MDSMKKKPVSALVVSLGETLRGISLFLCADRWPGLTVYSSWWSSATKDKQTEHELIGINESSFFYLLMWHRITDPRLTRYIKKVGLSLV